MQMNLLTDWYERLKLTCSPFQITPLADRKIIEYIFRSLTERFGLAYFDVTVGQDVQEENIPWLFSLLANKDHVGCIYGLYHTAQLTEYLFTLDEQIQDKFRRLLSSAEPMRTFYFELFIFHLCDTNNIPNEKKIWEGDQELEGTLTINNRTFLYECRKIFMPRRHEVDFVRRTMSLLHQQLHTITRYFPSGMIWTLQCKRPLKFKTGYYVNQFNSIVTEFIGKLNGFTGTEIKYECELEGCLFSAINFSEADHFELKNDNKHDILVTIKPDGAQGLCRANMTGNFGIERNRIYKKLEAALREKRDQHKDSIYEHQIIFIDNEEFPELNMPLFPNDHIIEMDKILRIYDKLKLTAIVAIIRRQYMRTGINYSPLMFFPEHLKKEAEIIKNAISKMQSR